MAKLGSAPGAAKAAAFAKSHTTNDVNVIMDILAARWDHEPLGIPFNRPSAFAKPTANKPGTFSPTGGEGWDEGVRFTESSNQVFIFMLSRFVQGLSSQVSACGSLSRFQRRREVSIHSNTRTAVELGVAIAKDSADAQTCHD
jgi:hypothetical protein